MSRETVMVALQAVLAIILTFTVCYLAIMQQDVPDFLLAAFTLVMGFLYGQQVGLVQRVNGELAKTVVRAQKELQE